LGAAAAAWRPPDCFNNTERIGECQEKSFHCATFSFSNSVIAAYSLREIGAAISKPHEKYHYFDKTLAL